MKYLRLLLYAAGIMLVLGITAYFIMRYKYQIHAEEWVLAASAGTAVDSFNHVKIYANGRDYTKSHGTHYAADGYYYGKKWQCVEFVKRYYKDHLGHEMPEVYGHAKDFWERGISHGGYNTRRNLYQYYNDSTCRPAVNDLLVFPHSSFGHVAIVSKVEDGRVEVVQQNIIGRPREWYDLVFDGHNYSIAQGERKPVGWLRK